MIFWFYGIRYERNIIELIQTEETPVNFYTLYLISFAEYSVVVYLLNNALIIVLLNWSSGVSNFILVVSIKQK
jgi:hypothetical protein